MNKRFSTLLASALLAVGSFSVSAAVGTPVGSLAIGNNEGKLYQLVTAGGSVLAIQNDSLKLMPVANANASILNTLWCVDVERYNQGQAIKFEFRNKATGQLLEVSEDYLEGLPAGATTADLEVGGAIGGWAFSNALKPLQQGRSLYYYFNGDSVVTLDKSANGVDLAGNAYLALTKREAKEGNDYVSENATAFTLVEADAITLTAEQINTVLGTQEATAGVKLKFDEDKNGVSQKNYFTDDAKFFADTTMAGAASSPWVRILTGKKEDSTYVYVDTAYTNANGVMFLDFNTQQLKHAKLSKNTTGNTTVADSLGMLNDQAKFLFTYWPSIDSLVIQVKQITNLGNNANFAAAYATGTDTVNIATGNDDKRNYVTVQDLVEADDIRIVTINDKKETEISFGISGCGEYVGNKVTLDEGLYLIKNKEDKYLAVPIHEDSIPHWVSLEDNVEPWDMTAFQWVIEKKRKNSDVSALKITNREFEKVVIADGLQLYNDADATIFGAAVEVEGGFEKASAEIMADAHRGYRFLNNDSLKVTA